MILVSKSKGFEYCIRILDIGQTVCLHGNYVPELINTVADRSFNPLASLSKGEMSQ